VRSTETRLAAEACGRVAIARSPFPSSGHSVDRGHFACISAVRQSRRSGRAAATGRIIGSLSRHLRARRVPASDIRIHYVRIDRNHWRRTLGAWTSSEAAMVERHPLPIHRRRSHLGLTRFACLTTTRHGDHFGRRVDHLKRNRVRAHGSRACRLSLWAGHQGPRMVQLRSKQAVSLLGRKAPMSNWSRWSSQSLT
jgi:hypothetical protein